MKMNMSKRGKISLFICFLILCGASASYAVVDFKEVKAVSASIDEIYLEGRNDFILPPGEKGQLVTETTPSDLQDQVRWAITGGNLDAEDMLDAVSEYIIEKGGGEFPEELSRIINSGVGVGGPMQVPGMLFYGALRTAVEIEGIEIENIDGTIIYGVGWKIQF